MDSGRKDNLMEVECIILMSGFMLGISRMGLEMERALSKEVVNYMRGSMQIT
jgi:hypothetical protein